MSINDPVIEAVEAGGQNGNKVERREEPRLPLQLKVAIVYHEHADEATRPTYHGRTNDISVHGLSVLVGSNIFNDGQVTVLLAVPPEHIGGAQKIVEATAKMAYTVFSSAHNTFRIGLNFVEFKRTGKAVLDAFIKERRMLLKVD